MRARLRKRYDARSPWRRPPLPIALLLGYAWMEFSPHRSRWIIVVEADHRDLAPALASIPSDVTFDAGTIEVPG